MNRWKSELSIPMFELASPPDRPRILVVDDRPINIRAIHRLFRDDSEVLGATSGDRAIEICRRLAPDLVLLDVLMPDMDGYEVCRRLKEDPDTREIPVIFLTSVDGADDEAHGFGLGAVDYISKPFNPSVVRARVHTQLVLKAQADMLRSMAFVDGLTGVANRRLFEYQVEIEWRACLRSGAPLSVLMIDVDHFKQFNDAYGHPEGDRCLRSLARALQGGLGRARDLLARYGGEEFACVLPETDLDGARVKTEELRRAVESLAIPHRASPTGESVTVSIGGAVCHPSEAGSAARLLLAADQQLYKAKAAGRNRVLLAEIDDFEILPVGRGVFDLADDRSLWAKPSAPEAKPGGEPWTRTH